MAFLSRRMIVGLLGAVLTGLTPTLALAQDYPAKPIRMVVPFPPGGATGPIAALFAERISEKLGQPIILDHISGSGAMLGAAAAAKADPDGYNLFFGTVASQVTSPIYNGGAPYDPIQDFTPISLVGTATYLIVLHKSVPAETVPELATLLREDPDLVFLGSSGIGSGSHIAGEMFAEALDVQITHVPYQGSAPHIVDFAAGRVQLGFTPITLVETHLKSGVLKVIGVAADERLAALPDVPTFLEQEGKSFVSGGWYGLFAPKGLAPEIVARLNAATQDVLADPLFRERLLAMGVDPRGSTPEELGDFVEADIARMGPTIERLAAAEK